jgi:hypothetical protein
MACPEKIALRGSQGRFSPDFYPPNERIAKTPLLKRGLRRVCVAASREDHSETRGWRGLRPCESRLRPHRATAGVNARCRSEQAAGSRPDGEARVAGPVRRASGSGDGSPWARPTGGDSAKLFAQSAEPLPSASFVDLLPTLTVMVTTSTRTDIDGLARAGCISRECLPMAVRVCL